MCRSTEAWPLWPVVCRSSVGAERGALLRGGWGWPWELKGSVQAPGRDQMAVLIPGLKKAHGGGEDRWRKGPEKWPMRRE